MGVRRSNGDGDVTDFVRISAFITLLAATDFGPLLCTVRVTDAVTCAFPARGELVARAKNSPRFKPAMRIDN